MVVALHPLFSPLETQFPTESLQPNFFLAAFTLSVLVSAGVPWLGPQGPHLCYVLH